MRYLRPTLAGFVLLAQTACGGSRIESKDYVTPVTGSTLAALTLAVPEEGAEDRARCDDRVRSMNEMRGTPLSMVWDDSGEQTRRVTVVFDEDGQPIRYSDTRGALGNIRTLGKPIPGTSIMLSWANETALVQNQDSSGTRSTVRVDFAEALESEKLGRPSEVAGKVWEKCLNAGQMF